MKKKLSFAYTLIAIVSIVAAGLFSAVIFYISADQNSKELLEREAKHIAKLIESNPDAIHEDSVQMLLDSTELAILDNKHNILYGKINENEKKQLLEQLGDSSLAEPAAYGIVNYNQYCILRADNGNIILLRSGQTSILSYVFWMLPLICACFAPTLYLCSIFAGKTAKKLAEPINTIDINGNGIYIYEELKPLVENIAEQKRNIENTARMHMERQEEFFTVAKGMQEGLILLNKEDCIAYINPYAKDILGKKINIGDHFLVCSDDEGFRRAVRSSRSKGSAEETYLSAGKTYQILVHSIIESGRSFGTVILILDISERADAERTRREFTANVSHELKTPLTSILGYADIIRNGWVKEGDIPVFASRICDETKRLITLIEDIIRLSRLDEGSSLPEKERLSLSECVTYTVNLLSAKAENRQICLNICGKDEVIFGAKQIVHEIIYNLCDNAIKYNKVGGTVTIETGEEDESIFLSVRDSGIGIAPEDQSKVFERFYRVDKSHSKETGGTGLGLSIVKHGAEYHGASIVLNSEIGKGTEIKILFPKNRQEIIHDN